MRKINKELDEEIQKQIDRINKIINYKSNVLDIILKYILTLRVKSLPVKILEKDITKAIKKEIAMTDLTKDLIYNALNVLCDNRILIKTNDYYLTFLSLNNIKDNND